MSFGFLFSWKFPSRSTLPLDQKIIVYKKPLFKMCSIPWRERRARVQSDPDRGMSPCEFSKEVGIFRGVSETGVSTYNIENYCHEVTAFFDYTSTFQR